MATPKQTVEVVIPSARRLIKSLRDVGYDFRHAVADLVDNSIAAGASQIAIKMEFDGNNSFVRIADNGAGMDSATITEAMRFGTEREYEADELGKFGLGLKTASLSQCTRFTVASRPDQITRHIQTRQWDLAHVESTNRWEIINVPASDRPDVLTEPLLNTTGTVVLWEQLDRVLGYKVPWGERAYKGFLRLAGELDQHLGMVFHRFLSGEARGRKKISITLNGTSVEAWDPFARDENDTLQLHEKQLEIHGDDGPGLIAYTPYILPRQDRFSSLEMFNHYAGPRKWNFQQGFYIYRADRLIQSGSWSYMRTADEHTKLARAALDFWPDLDSAFDLNVAKARVRLPADLREQIQPLVEQLTKQARKVYSTRPTSTSKSGSSPQQPGAQAPASGAIRAPDTVLTQPRTPLYGGHTSAHDLAHIGRAIEKAASSAGENEALERIRKTLKDQAPKTAAEIGWSS